MFIMTDGPIEGGTAGASAPVGDSSTGQEVNSAQGQEPQAGEVKQNPAWQPFLDVLPKELHPIVTPVLKDWDRGVQERFESIHKDYEPFKPFREAGVDTETLMYGVGLVNALNEDPQKVYDSLAEFYHLTPAEVKQAADEARQPNSNADLGGADYGELPDDPRIAEMQKNMQDMAQFLASEQQQKLKEAEDRKIEQEFSSLREKYGEYDERYVLGLMLNGSSAEDAVKAYGALVNDIRTNNNRPPAPKVLGGGSNGVASTRVDPATLNDKQRKELVAERLRAAHEAAS